MSLYGDALAAIRSIILVDERVQSLAGKVDRLGDEVRRMADRVTRLETIVEIARPDGAVLRIATPGGSGASNEAPRPSEGRTDPGKE